MTTEDYVKLLKKAAQQGWECHPFHDTMWRLRGSGADDWMNEEDMLSIIAEEETQV